MCYRFWFIGLLLVVTIGMGANFAQAGVGTAGDDPAGQPLMMSAGPVIDTGLELIDNQLNYPIPGEGEFAFDVGAVVSRNGDTLSVRVFQGSFLLDPIFRAQVLEVRFSGYFFPDVWYGDRTEIYDDIPSSPNYGRLFYRYAFTGGTMKRLDDDPQRVMTVVIRYKMIAFHGQISWNNGQSDFNVLDEQGNNITGTERTLPADFDDISLPVELTSFQARNNGQGVTLVWRTGSEDENLGFHLYRSDDGGQEYAKVTGALIAGSGSSTSAHFYQYDDLAVVNGKTYHYKLADVDARGKVTYHGPVAMMVKKVTAFSLEANYPNPFNAGTMIRFTLPFDSNVTLALYDVNGRQIRTLMEGERHAGEHLVSWDGRDQTGRPIASGLYFCTLTSGEFSRTIRLVLAK